MKRYLLFVGVAFDSVGGWNEFHAAYDSVDDAKRDVATISPSYSEWAHIVDLETMKIVCNAERKLASQPNREDGPLEWTEGTLRK